MIYATETITCEYGIVNIICVKIGVIYVDAEWYFIEPLESSPENVGFRGRNNGSLAKHVIYPRNATTPSSTQHTCHVKG